MRIVFMGTPDIAASILQALIESEHTIIGVVTQPDRPKGRGSIMTASPVKELAVAHQIPVFQPERLKEEWIIEELKTLSPDMIVVAAFGQILPKVVLDLPPFGCINVHASLLPKYRGAAPIQWAVLNGEKETGITIMYMDPGIDTGEIILQEKVELSKDETGGSLFDKLARIGGPVLLKAIKQISEGTANRIAQNNAEATYVKVFDKTFGLLDFNKPAKVLECYIRGLDPWPCAYTKLDGRILKLWKARVIELDEVPEQPVGTIVYVGKEQFYIKTSEGLLAVLELQLEGKRRMTCEEFLRGFKLSEGTCLGK